MQRQQTNRHREDEAIGIGLPLDVACVAFDNQI